MKRFITSAALVTSLVLVALQVHSDEPGQRPASPSVASSDLEFELIKTLRQAFEESVAGYRQGIVAVHEPIRLSGDLYQQELARADASDRRIVAEAYLERASDIERIALAALADGVGTSTARLEAKADRLKAQLEIAKWQQ